MQDQTHCQICGTQVETSNIPPDSPRSTHQKCPYCGEFTLAPETYLIIKERDELEQVKISGWVLDQNREGVVPTISKDVLKQILARALPTVAERANRLLLEALQQQDQVGESIDISDPRFLKATYSQDADEVTLLGRLLSEKRLMDQPSPQTIDSQDYYEVLPLGYVAADELTRRVARSNKGFVAMWFDNKLERAYENGFQVGILNAGYDPVRMDQVEHTNRIDDEIIAHIRTASFVVADFTGHRGGVYFEAGFALGIGRQVIWTCREDHMEDLHFDIRQYNTIDWKNPEDLATRLQHRLEATVGKGPEAVLNP